MRFATIFKRKKPKQIIPSPDFSDNWKQNKFNENVKEGVLSLQNGKQVKILDDGRGYELAYEIKRQFILEYQKQLAEHIRIGGGNIITIQFKE